MSSLGRSHELGQLLRSEVQKRGARLEMGVEERLKAQVKEWYAGDLQEISGGMEAGVAGIEAQGRRKVFCVFADFCFIQ